MRTRLVRLRGPEGRVFLLERGVLDERALVAFVGGQCHGLALAIHDRTGWPLVAVDNEQGECVHVCLRRPDDLLVDVTGSHSDDEMTADGRQLRSIGCADVGSLVACFGWAPPELRASHAWVDAVLERAETGPALPPMATARISREEFHDGYEVRFEWEGDVSFSVTVRRPGQVDWVDYCRVSLRADSSGDYVIDFSAEQFDVFTDRFMAWQFDPRLAEAKLVDTGR